MKRHGWRTHLWVGVRFLLSKFVNRAPTAKAMGHPMVSDSSFILPRSSFPPYTSATMLKRRKIRELAMQILFLWDTQQERNDELAGRVVGEAEIDDETRRQALEMADGTWKAREAIDAWIERLAP